jgi:hypothetical protein
MSRKIKNASYISAYDLQKRVGLSRRKLLELAATQPTFCKVPVAGRSITPEKEACIDWTKYTPDRQYFLNGLDMLKEHAACDWHYVADTFKSAGSEYKSVVDLQTKTTIKIHSPMIDPYDKFALDHMLYARLPRMIPGRAAEALLETMCPQSILADIEQEYSLQSIIACIDRGRMLNLVTLPSECKSVDDIWLYLCDSYSVVIDLYFEKYFREWLFFYDNKTQQIDNNQQNTKSHNMSLSSVDKEACTKLWYDHRKKLTKLNKREWCLYSDAHIAELLFKDKIAQEIFDIVFPNKKNIDLPNAKRQSIHRAKFRINKYAQDKGLPMPPGCEDKIK